MLLVELVYRHIVERVLLSFTYNKGALTTEVDHLIRDITIYHKYIWRIHQHSIFVYCWILITFIWFTARHIRTAGNQNDLWFREQEKNVKDAGVSFSDIYNEMTLSFISLITVFIMCVDERISVMLFWTFHSLF